VGAEEAPPSYEDAMAEEITQADGPRREYSGVTDVNAPNMDEKQTAAPRYSTLFSRGRGGGGSGDSHRGGSGGGFGAVV
jgi:hypothetical protein